MTNTYINRHSTTPVKVGSVTIGGKAPIAIQAMTNTLTQQADLTIMQILQLYQAGAELVRIAIDTEEAAEKVRHIRQQLNQAQCFVPLIGDFHYNGHILLQKYPGCAKALDKYRINPGNVDTKNSDNDAFDAIVKLAKKYKKPIRIGANSGSVSQLYLKRLQTEHPDWDQKTIKKEALIQSTLDGAKRAERLGLKANQIILSCKVNDISSLHDIYRKLAKRCHYALHLGLTESGPGIPGIIASSIGIGGLLQEGIGDTIRTSITPDAQSGDRTLEVKVSEDILQTLGIRYFKPQLITCPGCGRTQAHVFEQLVFDVKKMINQRNLFFKKHLKSRPLKIAIMGCVVNGPGESEQADIGLYLNANHSSASVFINHEKSITLKGDDIAYQFVKLLEETITPKKKRSFII